MTLSIMNKAIQEELLKEYAIPLNADGGDRGHSGTLHTPSALTMAGVSSIKASRFSWKRSSITSTPKRAPLSQAPQPYLLKKYVGRIHPTALAHLATKYPALFSIAVSKVMEGEYGRC